MKLYKYKSLFALIATIGWISFIYSAFLGFHFWYLGFVFFFWLSLGILNYRHESSLWLLKNRWSRFFQYYGVLVFLGFFGDYLIAQKLINLWEYRAYSSIYDWSRLYLLVYPIGGLSVIELIYFLASLFKEKVVLIHLNVRNLVVGKLEHITDAVIVLLVFLGLVFKDFIPVNQLQNIIIFLLLVWTFLNILRLKYYVRHWSHWFAIIISTTFLSVFTHEVPNTAVYEWKYNSLHLSSFFNYPIFDMPIWIFSGWFLVVLLMLRCWVTLVLLKNRK